MKIGLLNNLNSRWNRRGIRHVHAALGPHPNVLCADVVHAAEITPALRKLLCADIDVLAINGGDGTDQAVLTDLIRETPAGPWPTLALMRGGATNMTAADIGLSGTPPEALRRLVALVGSARPLPKRRRTAMRLTYGPRNDALYGFFLGGGAISRTVQFAEDVVGRTWVPPALSIGYSFVLGVLGGPLSHLTGRELANDSFFKADRLLIRTDGGAEDSIDAFLFLLTTLDTLLYGAKPYWGEGPHPLRVTCVRHPPRRFVRATYLALHGQADETTLPDDYASWTARELSVSMQGPFALDGEIHHPGENMPVTVSAGPTLSFVAC